MEITRFWFVLGGILVPPDYRYRRCWISVEGQHEFCDTFSMVNDSVLERPAITHRTLPCKVHDGRLDVRIYGGAIACLRALVVYLTKSAAHMRALTERIVEAYYLPRCVDVSEPVPPLRIAPSAQDLKRGFMFFTVEPLQPLPMEMEVQVRSSHLQEELKTPDEPGYYELRAAACAGEYEPLTFALWALRDLKDVRVRVRWERRAPISVDVRQVRWLKVSTATRPTREWRWEPRVLTRIKHKRHKSIKDIKDLSIGKGTVVKLWLTMQPSEKAKAGIYRGRVDIVADGALASVPIVFTVRSFRLHPLRDRYHAVWWMPLHFVDGDRAIEMQFRDMSKHGITATTLYLKEGTPKVTLSKDGGIQLDFSGVAKVMELRKRYGLTGPTPNLGTWNALCEPLGKPLVSNSESELVRDERFRKLYPQVVLAIQAEAKKRGWAQLWEYVVG